MWGGTSSLPVRFVTNVLGKGITDKGEVSLYCRGYAFPSNTIKSSFLLNKSIFQRFLYYPYNGLRIPLLPVRAERLRLNVSVLQTEAEGAQRVAGFRLAAPTITIN